MDEGFKNDNSISGFCCVESAQYSLYRSYSIDMIVEQQGGGRCAPGLALLRTWTQRELPACIGE